MYVNHSRGCLSTNLVQFLTKIFIWTLRAHARKTNTNRVSINKFQPQPTINLVTTWNARCGIASYSASLANELRKLSKVYITKVLETQKLNFARFFVLGVEAGRLSDVVHVQCEYGVFGLSAFFLYIGLALARTSVITTFHEVMKETGGGIAGKLYKMLSEVICNVSNFTIVHTLESRELLSKICAVPRDRLVVIPHGSFENPIIQDKDACKAKLNLQGKTVLTIPGFVRRNKGHDLLINVIPLLNKRVHLLIAGGPRVKQHEAYYEQLKQKAQQQGIIGRVTFSGYIPDEEIPVVMSATDIAVLPHIYGVTQSGILHILVAYRIPTITSDLEAFKEVASQYGCLQLFKVGDRKDLFEKVSALLNDEEKQSLLRARCEEMWNNTKWSAVAKKHVEVYLKALTTKNE